MPFYEWSRHTCLIYFLRISSYMGGCRIQGQPTCWGTNHTLPYRPPKNTRIISIPTSSVKQNPVPPHSATRCHQLYKTWPMLQVKHGFLFFIPLIIPEVDHGFVLFLLWVHRPFLWLKLFFSPLRIVISACWMFFGQLWVLQSLPFMET